MFVCFIWSCCFTYLVLSSQEPLQWIGLSIIAFLTIIFIIFLSQSLKQQDSYEQRLRQLQIFSSVASEFAEVVIFNDAGKTIYTTHPHLYPHKKEFLRKVLAKVSSNVESATFKKWVEEHHTGEIILSSGGNGLGQQRRRWIARVRSIDPTLMRGENFVLVVLSDMTTYLEGFHKIKQAYNSLEVFLDNAPMALLYVSNTDHIIGCNQTLASWLEISKDDLIGEKASGVVANFEVVKKTKESQIVSFKLKKARSFKAIYLPPDPKGKKRNDAAIICRLDSSLSNMGILNKELKDEVSFIHSKVPSIVLDEEGLILSMNPSFGEMIVERKLFEDGFDHSDLNFYDLLDASIALETKDKISEFKNNPEKNSLIETLFIDKDHPMMIYVSVLNNALSLDDKVEFLLQFIDISDQKRLEQQFSQSQKMQAVGQLAGGIAHDFNNLLTAMIGFCDLLLQRYVPNDPSYMDVVQIKQNANRAANLVRQLLAFSRQQALQPKVIDVTEVLSEISALLRRLIGVDIEFKLIHGNKLDYIKADISQFEQIMINMAVNARDAMEGSGVLTIKTMNYLCERKKQIHHEIMPKGEYVLIEIQDTGTGISPDIIERVFEPFFSTKEVGKGTGLGLSTVYGIIKQSNGFIEVESKLGEGALFKIYFPKAKAKLDTSRDAIEEVPNAFLVGGTILLVEDEEAVRMFSARALREKGYEVIEADNGEEALEIVKKGKKFDLLVTDVVMPKMDGPTLNKLVRESYPDTKTIFISGYTEDTFRKNLGNDVQIHFLSKPFSLKELIKKVQGVLTNKNTPK